MRAFIKSLVKTYFDEHSHEFGEGARFREFLIVDGSASKENSYPAELHGYIMYACNCAIRSSGRIRVQYYRCAGDDTRRLMLSSWFANEAIFCGQIWPLCADQASGHLVPKLRASGEHLSSTASMGALLFECDEGVHNWGYMCRLRDDHLALMARRIGHVHGRMLETRARHRLQLSQAADALTVSVQPDAGRVRPTLERCLAQLEASLGSAGSAQSVRRLRRLIAELEDGLRQPTDARCSVVRHGNYSQACAFFGYRRATPATLRIGYWAKVGWSSMADDLVVLMLVDAGSRWSLERRVRLLDHYMEGLRTGCPDEWVPTRDDIWREIRLRIPVALYALAARVDGLGERAIRAGRLESSARWNDEFVVDVYKFLISSDLV